MGPSRCHSNDRAKAGVETAVGVGDAGTGERVGVGVGGGDGTEDAVSDGVGLGLAGAVVGEPVGGAESTATGDAVGVGVEDAEQAIDARAERVIPTVSWRPHPDLCPTLIDMIAFLLRLVACMRALLAQFFNLRQQR